MTIETKYARIGNAFETEDKYLNSDIKPLKGEILGVSNKNGYSKIKIGDGINKYEDLKFIDQEAIDLFNNKSIKFLGSSLLKKYQDQNLNEPVDTAENWIKIGTGICFLNQDDKKIMFGEDDNGNANPAPWGNSNAYMLNIAGGTIIYQNAFPITETGAMWHRVGSIDSGKSDENGWFNQGEWKANATRDWVTNQIQQSIDATWRASY
jgi:hypothetical protein